MPGLKLGNGALSYMTDDSFLPSTIRIDRRLVGLKKAVLFLSFLSLTILPNCGSGEEKPTQQKVVVIGIDGLDPQLLNKFMSQDKLPNFQKLKDQGGFKPLATSIPPQSPVAWSNFITGMDPGGHGIFDFIHRDPNTILPYFSISRLESSQKTIKVGKWIIPLSSGKAKLLRNGKAFWEYLSEHKIPTTILKVPANFPPVETKGGNSISGMGTPDILGTYGTFTYYTDAATESYEDISGGSVINIKLINNTLQASLVGPPNPFREGNPDTQVDFTVWRDPENPVGKIEIQGEEILLNEGEWSEWLPIRFELVPYFKSVSAIVRFFLKEVHPHFRMYVTPINIDPSDPALPISTPAQYAGEVCESVGYFYTQGMPEDTKALQAGILNDAEYLEQARIVLEEEVSMLEFALDRFEQGFLFYYFSSVDQNCHVFWRAVDSKHVFYSEKLNQQFGDVIERLYGRMDDVVGRVLEKIEGSNTTLLIMSDHGFVPFYRAFHLNTWLKNEGYIVLKDALKQGEAEVFQNVDWRKTRAYALGLNGLYLNLRGREFSGIVRPGCQAQLLALKDRQNGQPIIAKIYRSSDVYHGPYVKQAPDLLIGFNRGYRASWETILGKIPKEMLIDNEDKWSGDHCIAAEFVPGVVLSNKPIQKESPALYDLAPTILHEFGLEKGEQMIGNSIFERTKVARAQ